MRAINNQRKHLSDRVSSVVIHTWFKYIQEPKLSEGFKEIKIINHIAGPFENKKDEKMYFMCYEWN